MAARYGPMYASAVLRPFAEQMVEAMEVRPGAVVCDLMCDSGELARMLARAVGASGTVLLVDSDRAALDGARAAVEQAGATPRVALIDGADDTEMPAMPGGCDRVGSLFTLGFGDPTALLARAARLQGGSGTISVLAWDPQSPPAHEAALTGALRSIAGARSAFLDSVVTPVLEPVAALRVRDVVCFDGIEQYWTAMVRQRPVAAEIAHLQEGEVAAVRDACAVALRSCTGHDGTMRIGVDALLVRRQASRATTLRSEPRTRR